MNRRAMLGASIGAIALSLSGCKKTKTTIVVVNADPAKVINVSASAGGNTVTVKKLGVGKSSKKFVFRSDGKLGTVVPGTGTVTSGGAPVPLAPFTVTVGYTNTLAVDSLGTVVNTVT